MIMTIITNVLADSGSSIQNIIKCNVYLTDMKKDFAAMNEAYLEFFPDAKGKPVSTNHLRLDRMS
jgi:enamine deaminase RidA (YjgF/YER057c/UK114 family)